MNEQKCRLQSDCGRYYDSENHAHCWCYSTEHSRRRLEQVLGEVQRLENYVAALEDECSVEQLRAARKSVETSRADHIGDINEMIQLEKKAQQ